MVALLKDILGVLIGIYLLTQIILPSFVPGLEYFNLHKKSAKKKATTLKDLDEKAEEVKKVKDEVRSTEEELTNIKNKINN